MIITDELLSAYLDGELSVEEIAEIAAEIEKSPELANRIEIMRLNDKSIAQAYHSIDSKPMPDSIMTMLEDFPESQKKALPFRKKSSFRTEAPIWQMAMAATILLFIGFGAGRTLMPANTTKDTASEQVIAQQNSGIIGPENALYAVLENQPSASSFALSANNDAIITPSMTFRTNENIYCREYSVTTQKSSTQNVACRVENTWVVKISVGTTGKVLPEDGTYQTASQMDNSAITAVIKELMAGDALSADDEVKIIKQNWQQK